MCSDNRHDDSPPAEPSIATGVTQLVRPRESSVTPLMSYTAVTTHPEMAAAFVNQVLHYCRHLIPDRTLTPADLVTIAHAAMEHHQRGVPTMEGKYLRGRISEQLARSRRYGEVFSLVALRFRSDVKDVDYDAVLDTLRERLRRSDMVFTFKKCIFLLLPHTPEAATLQLLDRVRALMDQTFAATPLSAITYLAFPSPAITRSSQVLDWAEDQLR